MVAWFDGFVWVCPVLLHWYFGVGTPFGAGVGSPETSKPSIRGMVIQGTLTGLKKKVHRLHHRTIHPCRILGPVS